MTDPISWKVRANAATQPQILLSADDHHRLLKLATGATARYPADDVRMLLDELSRADIVPADWLPTEVVAMNSYVEFRDELTGIVRRMQLVFPHHADIGQGRVSVLSLIGAALIGLAEGQSIAWDTPTGRRGRLTVLRVDPAPFAEDPGDVVATGKRAARPGSARGVVANDGRDQCANDTGSAG